MALSGSQLTRIGSFLSGVAKKLTILAKAAAPIPNPASFAAQGNITSDGSSVRSAFSTSGVSVQSSISNSFSVLSAISSDGVSVRSAIDTTGQSVRANMQG